MSKTRFAVSVLAFVSPLLLAGQYAVSGQMTVAVGGPQGPPPLSAPPSNTPPEQRCVVQGRVTNSLTGEPLKKVSVHLRFLNQAPSGPGVVGQYSPQGYSATSDADGSFKFEGVEPGVYTLSGDRSGYLSTQFGAKGPTQPGTNLTLRPTQQMTDLNLALIPQATITGKVVDDDGDPVGRVMVQALAQTWQRGKLRYMPRGGSSTDDRGEYRLANLSPGKYYITAQKFEPPFSTNETPANPGKPDIRPVRTFYPEAPNMESASTIEVRAGQDASGMDIRLRSAQTYHVRGKIVGDIAADSDRIMVSVGSRDENFMMFGGASNVTKDHTFDLAGIAPGSYSLNVTAMGNGPARFAARLPIDVGAADLNDVVVTVYPPGSIRGQIQLEGTPPAGTAQANISRTHIFLNSTEGTMMGSFQQTTVKQDGTFSLEKLSPGKYYPNISGIPDGSYIKSVRFNHQEILGKEMDLSQGSAGDLEIILRYGAAEVDGTLRMPQGANGTEAAGAQGSAPRASILLVPDALNADGSGIRFSSADQNGTFSIKQVPPGHYRAYALEQVNMGQLQNPDLLKQLESKSTEVEVKENDKKQIQLSLMPADELQQVFAKLGIDSPQ